MDQGIGTSLQDKKILMIEDDEHYAMVTRHSLTRCGCKVFHAQDGKDGLRKAKWHRPDAILLDLTMPKMDGLEVLKHLKADPATANIPVAILTSRDSNESMEQAMRDYAHAYLSKACDLDVIIAKLQQLLRVQSAI